MYFEDLNLVMTSSQEKCEEELIYVEKQLEQTQGHLASIQDQIRRCEGDTKSQYFRNLLSLLDHLLSQNQYLVKRHSTLRKNIRKLQAYQREQQLKLQELRERQMRFQKFIDRRKVSRKARD